MWVKNKQPGFTIVELLIVVVVIAILAAITIVAYAGIQQRARESAVSSSVSQAKKKLEVYKVEKGSYPLTNDFSLAGITDPSVNYQYTSSDGLSFCVTGTIANTSYKVSNTSPLSKGGCPGHNQSGIVAITNKVANPSFETVSGSTVVGIQSVPDRGLAEASTIGVQSGIRSLKITPLHTSTDSFVTISNPGIQANTTYTALLTYTLVDQLNSPGSPRFRFNIGGADMASSTSYPKTPGTHQIRWTFSVGESNAINFLRIMPGGTLNEVPVYFDNLMIVEGDYSGGYYDGNSPNWIWVGAPNNSTSIGPPL